MKILFLASEVTGLLKTGGLADVARALPLALRQRGHDVRLVLPLYLPIARTRPLREAVPFLGVPMGNTELFCSVQQTRLESLPVYLIEYQHFFFRERPYQQRDGSPYPDNAERFGFFCKAALQLCLAIGFSPDIVHANDWQTALAPFYLQSHRKRFKSLQHTRSVLTLHNGGYQGAAPANAREFLGIDDDWFHPQGFEDHGQLNLLKGGIHCADKLNAVSPGYAEELQTPLGGHGLHEHFQQRQADLSGILNGCEYEVWNPADDPHLPAHYDLHDLSGKTRCKSSLQAELNLPESPRTPLIGVISRLTDQKGFDFSLPAIRELLQGNVQFAVLGSGDAGLAQQLRQLMTEFPQQLHFHEGYSEPLAHRIEAGCDLFLMPSLYEPCGLNQMYSLRYGTLPVVRAVGGLKNSVWESTADGELGTGFVFTEPSSEGVRQAIERALVCYQEPERFAQMIANAMRQRFSWDQTATRYEALYESALHPA
jgi:starch synthase